jgi:hypothetical protein
MNLINKLFNRYSGHPEAVIISCYYNPTKSKYRRRAFDTFYQSIKHLNHKIVECVIGDGVAELGGNIEKVRTENLLWHKEALLNGIIEKLPKKYKYVFWVDADVIFTNKNWIVDSVEKFQQGFKILQPFEYCIHLEKDQDKPNFDVEKSRIAIDRWNFKDRHPLMWRSFCSNVPHSTLVSGHDYNSHGHVGFAWGARREVLDAVPLYDRALIGGADHVMAHAAAGDINHECIKKSFTENLTEITEWSKRFDAAIKRKISSVGGDLYHIWHGDIKNREYLKRIREFTPKIKNITNKDRNGLYVTHKPDDKKLVQYYERRESVDDGFATSMMLGYALDNGVLGGALGGNMMGGIVGDLIRNDTDTKIESAPCHSDAPPECDCKADTNPFS